MCIDRIATRRAFLRTAGTTAAAGVFALALPRSAFALPGSGSDHKYKAPQVFHSGDPNKPVAYLTTDDCLVRQALEEMGEVLYQEGAKMTFFPQGDAMADKEDVIRQLYMYGHQFENHTQTHRDLKELPGEDDIRSQLTEQRLTMENILNTPELVEKFGQYRQRFFRPPYISFDDRVINTSKELGMKIANNTHDTISWSVGSFERQLNPEPGDIDLAVKNATKDLKRGSIVLLHATTVDAKALRGIIVAGKEMGLNWITLNEGVE